MPIRSIVVLFAALLLCLVPLSVAAQETTNPRPPAAKTFTAEGLTIELFDDAIPQGRAGLVRVSGTGITAAQAEIFEDTVPFFSIPGQPDFYGFLTPGLDQAIRTYDMTLTVTANNVRRGILVPVVVSSGRFQRQDVTLREDQLALLDPQIETNEFAVLDGLTRRYTGMPFWAGDGFQLPADGELTSPFGAVRVFNESLETRHTGWDFNGEQGDTLAAMSNGRVVFSGDLAIRGGYVLVDHGYGVYSGYAHLSVRYVAVGEYVQKGQVIGLAGSTGRSSSAHLHIEMRVNNKWVDPVDFVNMWVPR